MRKKILITDVVLIAGAFLRCTFIDVILLCRTGSFSSWLSFFVAAVLTPPVVVSQMLMALPMVMLYEFSKS